MPSYNLKVKFYDSGEIQLHCFPVSIQYDTSSSVSGSSGVSLGSPSVCSEPDVDKKPSHTVDKTTSNFARSIRHTKNSVFDYALNNTWDYFVTFTFDQTFNRYDFPELRRYMSQFLQNYRKRHCEDMKYLGLPEFHKDGAIHFHFLISGSLPDNLLLPHCDQKKYPGAKYLKNWRGINVWEPVQNSVAISCYMCKYVVKDIIVNAGRARYISSRNLNKPSEEVFFYPETDLEGLDLSSYALKQFEEDYDIVSVSDGIGGSNYFRLMPKKSPE